MPGLELGDSLMSKNSFIVMSSSCGIKNLPSLLTSLPLTVEVSISPSFKLELETTASAYPVGVAETVTLVSPILFLKVATFFHYN